MVSEEEVFLIRDAFVLNFARAKEKKGYSYDEFAREVNDTRLSDTLKILLKDAFKDIDTVAKYIYIPVRNGDFIGQRSYYVRIGRDIYVVKELNREVVTEFIRNVQERGQRVLSDYKVGEANLVIRHVDDANSIITMKFPSINDTFENVVQKARSVLDKIVTMIRNSPEDAFNDYQKDLIDYALQNGWGKREYTIKVSLVKGDYFIHLTPDVITFGIRVGGSKNEVLTMFIDNEDAFEYAKEFIDNEILFWDAYFMRDEKYELYQKTGLIRPSSKVFARLKNELVGGKYIEYYYLQRVKDKIVERFKRQDSVPLRVFKVSTKITKNYTTLLREVPEQYRERVETGYVFHPLADAVPQTLRKLQLLVLKELGDIYGVEEVARKFTGAVPWDVPLGLLIEAIRSVEPIPVTKRKATEVSLDKFIVSSKV